MMDLVLKVYDEGICILSLKFSTSDINELAVHYVSEFICVDLSMCIYIDLYSYLYIYIY